MQYCNLLLGLKQTFMNECRSMLLNGRVFLWDDARLHIGKKTFKLLEKCRREVLQHSPYIPDIFPCDCHTFDPIKKISKRSEVLLVLLRNFRTQWKTRSISNWDIFILKLSTPFLYYGISVPISLVIMYSYTVPYEF